MISRKLSAISRQLSAVSFSIGLFPRGIARNYHSAPAVVFSHPGEFGGGCGRDGDADFARLCSIAMGSASELEYHLLLVSDLKLINPKVHGELAERTIELKRMLTALIQKLRRDR